MLWQKYKKVSLDDLFYIFNKHHMIHFCKFYVITNACLLIFIHSNKGNEVATASQNQIIS